jgi:hypothetical protein
VLNAFLLNMAEYCDGWIDSHDFCRLGLYTVSGDAELGAGILPCRIFRDRKVTRVRANVSDDAKSMKSTQIGVPYAPC